MYIGGFNRHHLKINANGGRYGITILTRALLIFFPFVSAKNEDRVHFFGHFPKPIFFNDQIPIV